MTRAALSLVLAAALGLAAGSARAQGQPCIYGGSEYSDGALSCQRGEQVQCMNGEWVDQNQTCTESSGGATGTLGMDSGAEQPQPTNGFMPGDSQVAPSSPDDMP